MNKKQVLTDSPTRVEYTERTKNIQKIIKDSQDEAVLYCEKTYPETMEEFKKIVNEQYVLFAQKQRSYGPDNISVGTHCKSESDIKLSLTGLWYRMFDKINRLKQLVILGQPNSQSNESITDTYQDLSVYSIICQIVSRKRWGK